MNGYGSIFDNAMNKPMFPGAGGYGGSVTVGQGVRARQAAAAQTGRNARQAAEMARPVSSGYGSVVTKGQAMAQSPHRKMAMPTSPARRAGIANPRTTGAARRTGGAARSVSNVPRNGSAIDLSRFAGNLTESSFPAGKKPLMSMFGNMTRGKKWGIGIGLGVAAGVAMNRRGEGVSPGRQSNARY